MPGAPPLVIALVKAAAAMAASYAIAKLTAQDPEKPDDPGTKVNPRTTTAPLGIPYGRCRVFGNEVFIEATGGSNKYLWIVQTLGEGECDSIYQVGGVDQVFLDDKLYNTYGGHVSYWFHNGSGAQTANSSLAAEFQKWTDAMRNTCYMVFRLTHNLDKFQNQPTRSAVIKGRKLYDPRTGTTEWDANAALILYDYLTNQRYGRKWPAGVIDTQSVIDAANYCDAKGWQYNKLVSDWNSQEVVDDILNHFRGVIIWSEGQFKLRYFDTEYESSVFTITDEHIYQDGSNRASLTIGQPSRWTKPDSYTCAFTDAAKNYTTDYLPVPSSGGGGIVEEISLSGFLNKQSVGKMGTYLLERVLLDRSLSGMYRDDLWALEPGDLVTHSSTALRFDNQLMRVVEVSPTESGVSITLMYESEDLYNDVFDLVPEDVYTCNLPDPYTEPPSVINVAVTEGVINWRLRSATNLNVYFEVPATFPWFEHVEVWRSWDDVTYEFLYYSGGSFTIDGIAEGTTLYLRLKTVSVHGVKQSDANDYKIQHTIGGASSVIPTSLSGLQVVVSGSAINLHAIQIKEADIDQYEFRLGSSWVGSLLLAAAKAPNYSLQGVKPGAHTFWVNTLATSGQYGSVPRSAVATLSDPPNGFSVTHTETDDFSTGFHDNTEAYTYGFDQYLRCTHAGGVLTGTYTGPLIDLGASAEVLIYILADVAVIGQGTDWDSIAPDPVTWEQLGLGNRWSEVVELPAGPQIRMRINYGETASLGNVAERMEILMATVTGRYFQVEVEITDPTSQVYALAENLTIKWCN